MFDFYNTKFYISRIAEVMSDKLYFIPKGRERAYEIDGSLVGTLPPYLLEHSRNPGG